jgi:A/G-specific adenine glycosylase
LILQSDISTFGKRLLEWWKAKGRKFPWRNTNDPYHILISEVLLHRTKANQVVLVYKELLKRYESADVLSRAPFNDIKAILYSLGLHWRIRSLHRMALEIVERHGGRIPETKDELESLTGVGHYIASAVRCFAFGYPEPLLDTNTVRILGKVFGVETTDASRRGKMFRELYKSILDREHSRNFGYAMIDLGALVCLPRAPLCNICPVNNMCKYGISKLHKSDL